MKDELKFKLILIVVSIAVGWLLGWLIINVGNNRYAVVSYRGYVLKIDNRNGKAWTWTGNGWKAVERSVTAAQPEPEPIDPFERSY